MEHIQQLQDAMVEGDEAQCAELAREIVTAGADLQAVIAVLATEMEEVGRRFEEMEIFLPEVLLAADGMAAVMEVFAPELSRDAAATTRGVVVLGTARGDMHQIGKDLVALFLQIGGFKVVDLGTDVDPLDFIHEAERSNADVIGISSLMTTTMPGATEVIKILADKGVRDRFRVVVGGAPTSQEWADKIGADGWAEEAGGAVDVIKELTAGRS